MPSVEDAEEFAIREGRLTADIVRLETENRELRTNQVEGVTADLVQALTRPVQAWIASDHQAVGTDGLFVGVETALDEGMQDAVRIAGTLALSELSPEARIDLARECLDGETFDRIAAAGLASVVRLNPRSFLNKLPVGVTSSLIDRLVQDPDLRDILQRELGGKHGKPRTLAELQQQYNQFGYFDMSNLAVGTRIKIAGWLQRWTKQEFVSCDGLVISTDKGNYIQPLGDTVEPFEEPFRLIAPDPDEDYTTRVIPGQRIEVAIYNPYDTDERVTSGTKYIKQLNSVQVNGKDFQFEIPD